MQLTQRLFTSKQVHIPKGTHALSTPLVIPPGCLLDLTGSIINTTAPIRLQGDACLLGGELRGKGYVEVTGSNNAVQGTIASKLDASWWGAFVVAVAPGKTLTGNKFIGCKAIDCNRFGFEVIGDYYNSKPERMAVTNHLWQGCSAINSGRYGRFMDSLGWGGAWETGFCFNDNITEISNSQVNDCYAEGAWESGFHLEYYLKKSNVALNRCISKNNGTKPAPDYGSGFLAGGGTSLNGCISEGNKISGVLYHGTSPEASSVQCVCRGNGHSALHTGDIGNARFAISSEGDARALWVRGPIRNSEIKLTIGATTPVWAARNTIDPIEASRIDLTVKAPTTASRLQNFKLSEVTIHV